MGDRVQVRDRDDETWMKGTVMDMVDGFPEVQNDEGTYRDESYSWEQVQPLVIFQ